MLVMNGGRVDAETLKQQLDFWVSGKFSKDSLTSQLMRVSSELKNNEGTSGKIANVKVSLDKAGNYGISISCRPNNSGSTRLVDAMITIAEPFARINTAAASMAISEVIYQTVRLGGIACDCYNRINTVSPVDIDFSDIFDEQFGYFITANACASDAMKKDTDLNQNVVADIETISEKISDVMDQYDTVSEALAKIAEYNIIPIDVIESAKAVYECVNHISPNRESEVSKALDYELNKYYDHLKELTTTVEQPNTQAVDMASRLI